VKTCERSTPNCPFAPMMTTFMALLDAGTSPTVLNLLHSMLEMLR
jgi:hypothetical protein